MKLKQILDEFDEKFVYGKKISDNERRYTLGTRDNVHKFIKKSCQSLLKDVVPKKDEVSGSHIYEAWGWNACIDEINSNIKEMLK